MKQLIAPYLLKHDFVFGGISSNGRARALHARGSGIDARILQGPVVQSTICANPGLNFNLSLGLCFLQNSSLQNFKTLKFY